MKDFAGLTEATKGQQTTMDSNFNGDICSKGDYQMEYIVFTMFHVKDNTLDGDTIYEVMRYMSVY